MSLSSRVLVIILVLTAPINLPFPASAERDVDGLEELLPREESEIERTRWLGREDEMPTRHTLADPPPTAPVRNCAEWEPCTGVLIRYPLGLPYSLLRDLDDDVILHVVVSSSYYASAQANLEANGVDMDRVQFLIKPNDSIWVRDYGPWFVFDGNGDLVIIDHVYNRPWRPNDNLIPVYFGEQQGIPVCSHDMYHTGGNYMTDGAHFSSSTRLVYEEAEDCCGMTEAQVDLLMSDYYGISTYNVMDYIESGGIHHIDTWAKFLDEETVLVKEVWPSHWTYTTLEQRATLLASLPSSTGRNYTVHRVYCYDIGGNSPASYTNSLILNKTIYVPTFGSAAYDSQALVSYETAAPGYDVRGYYLSGWLSDDALHCRTKGVMDRLMLRVEHIPIQDEMEGPVTVTALVDDRSELGVRSVKLYYRFAGGVWESTSMSHMGSDIYEGDIPNPDEDTTVDYYIHAEDMIGRTAGMPRVEPNRWYTFSILRNSLTEVAGETPAHSGLHGSFPNPFQSQTTFSFELRYPERAELVVFDARGRMVRRLVDRVCQAGTTRVSWDGTDDEGRSLPSGVYYYVLRTAGLEYHRPLVLMK